MTNGESSFEVSIVDGVPFLFGHSSERLVAENTSVANDDYSNQFESQSLVGFGAGEGRVDVL